MKFAAACEENTIAFIKIKWLDALVMNFVYSRYKDDGQHYFSQTGMIY